MNPSTSARAEPLPTFAQDINAEGAVGFQDDGGGDPFLAAGP